MVFAVLGFLIFGLLELFEVFALLPEAGLDVEA